MQTGDLNEENTARKSREFFDSGFYCSESVLMAIAESRGIESDIIPRIATAFSSGISESCGICGAVSGAVMGISLVFGRNSAKESIENSYEKTRKLLKMFEKEFGSCNCRELIGCDLGTKEGLAFFRSRNLIEACKNYTETATRMAIRIIENGISTHT